MSSRLPNLTTLGEVPLSLGVYARCQGLIVSSSTCLWLRRVTSIATPMFSRIWRSGPFRVTTRLHVWLFKNRLFGGQQGKRIPSWMSKHPTVKHRQPFGAPSAPRSSWQPVGRPDALTWELLGSQGTATFWEKTEAHCLLQERLELPDPSGEILSGRLLHYVGKGRPRRYLRTIYG